MTARSNTRRHKAPNTEQLDQEWTELVEELRLAIPGVEVLFGFLLVLPFEAGFSELAASSGTSTSRR